jgi:thymidylate synthase ThyX
MHSGSKFWSTLPVAKKKLEYEGIISKEKPFILPYKGIKIDEDTIIDIHLNSGPIIKEDIYFVLENGIAPEQARLFLPAYSMHVVYRWSCSLQSVGLFLAQRLEEQSQEEIRVYAQAIAELVRDLYPVSINALVGSRVYS